MIIFLAGYACHNFRHRSISALVYYISVVLSTLFSCQLNMEKTFKIIRSKDNEHPKLLKSKFSKKISIYSKFCGSGVVTWCFCIPNKIVYSFGIGSKTGECIVVSGVDCEAVSIHAEANRLWRLGRGHNNSPATQQPETVGETHNPVRDWDLCQPCQDKKGAEVCNGTGDHLY